ncbi:MAG TPA: hypothetical protein VK530_21050, partial [Candidatus Acidoferrum sp.]|nr:hypothetical protein [Candidatus Acidoferrum sp.]
MKRLMAHFRVVAARTVFTASVFAFTAMPLLAQTITNPSFEADAFAVAPGYISMNSPITGWTVGDPAKAGLNPAGGANPFANNGTPPNGSNVVFLLPTNYLSTVISGLTPGTKYHVQFRVNSQAGTAPPVRVALDNNPSLFDAGGIVSAAAANVGGLYKHVAFDFTASAASQTLYVSNNATAANAALLVDDFQIGVSTSGWSYAQWVDDATSGADSSKRYTHAFAFNVTGVPFLINGVPFTRLGGNNPALPYEFVAALGTAGPADAGNVIRTAAGGSANMATTFSYAGNPAILAFHNLIPGREYVATFYTIGWDGAGKSYGRSVTFAVGEDRLSINQDHFGDNVGTRISYRYTAPASGFMVFSNLPFSTGVGTLHTYGAANYEETSINEPVIGVHPVSKVSLPGSGAGFYVTAGGAGPLSFQWLKDGNAIPARTNRWLNLTNLTASDLAQYSVVVSNGFGSATSSAAGLTFSTDTFANPSFEGDTFMTWPGYVDGNFPIPGWFISNPVRVGLNFAAGGSPFVNNGSVPHGRDAAFIQSVAGASNWISTTVQNLTLG